jgi:hypothetical protein
MKSCLGFVNTAMKSNYCIQKISFTALSSLKCNLVAKNALILETGFALDVRALPLIRHNDVMWGLPCPD